MELVPLHGTPPAVTHPLPRPEQAGPRVLELGPCGSDLQGLATRIQQGRGWRPLPPGAGGRNEGLEVRAGPRSVQSEDAERQPDLWVWTAPQLWVRARTGWGVLETHLIFLGCNFKGCILVFIDLLASVSKYNVESTDILCVSVHFSGR